MYLLGISAFLDDPAAALLCDGDIIAIGEEERFIRVKHGVDCLKDKIVTTNETRSNIENVEIRHFPIESIDFCLKKAGIKLGELDFICVGFDLETILKDPANYNSRFNVPRRYANRRIAAFSGYMSYLNKLAKRARAKLVFVRHHIAHTFGTLFGSDFRKSVILTMDGMGELESTLLSCFNGDRLEMISNVELPHSIGRVYSSLTDHLGFRANYDEEKVMAMAGYGCDSYRKALKRLVKLAKLEYRIKPEYFWHKELGMGFANESLLSTVFGPKRDESIDPLEGPYKDIAKSLQEMLFEVSNQLVNAGFQLTGYQNLCLSGGVALNCENNGRLFVENEWLKDIYVQPQANDAGVALGAAYYVYFQATGRRGESQRHVYYGPSFSNEEIKSMLDRFRLKYHSVGDVCGEVSEKLSRGMVVGWFQGASEVGPRALGNRSLLASPLVKDVHKRISAEIKNRELWRPYAVTILDEARREYLDVDVYTPFMALSLPLNKLGRDKFTVAKHVNNTTRPQTLKRNINLLFYDLIKEFERDCGIPALLNTSFNVRNEPIINTPKQAVIDFITTGMDALVLGDHVLEK